MVNELKNEKDVRLKFGHEDKVDFETAHPDFLKVVALIRMVHGTLLKNIKPSEKHAIQIDKLVTYGLLTEKRFVRVLGIKAFVPQTSRIKKRYKYQLFNVGMFPLDPSTTEEKQLLDTFISFLLEASRKAIFEENILIDTITKASMGRKRMESSIVSGYDISQGDKLVVHLTTSLDTVLTTTVTLEEYLVEISTGQGRGTATKDMFYGVLDHSSQPVFVKIFHSEKPERFDIGNIFLLHDRVTVNDVVCKEHIEISIAGDELNTFNKRSHQEKLHIISQLLLEIDHIHSRKIIHNDIKPSNIIILEEDHLKSLVIKETDAHEKKGPNCFCKFIDFELAKRFDIEDGDTCKLANLWIQSTAGTSSYNAPEKESTGKNFIHPKTDIYSLGLVFIELILENDIDKKRLENTADEIWQTISIKCHELEPNKGSMLFDMLKQMVAIERKERPTTRECLALLGITDIVDTQDYRSYFFPSIRDAYSNPEKNESKLSTTETNNSTYEKKRKRTSSSNGEIPKKK
ncbi:predicted protein [Naegleria gruberi]|uniref:Predicted protein n=1 Tax=Naegleria gruberi TaxID=5762 RepID=D2W4D6_NAEGR|nr:uncharacterized protein NAEGRDRAFT_54593 [Naegleria gruberi]EFC36073.1 predicted protein [Naegleria gruberi]|eukprot:XP_002668817.1 predicted protein [Naegleria gruberi strain NEG-M]